MPVSDLSNAQLERLAILSEELGEAQQIIGKVLRHGYRSYNPFDHDKISNQVLLTKELGDVLHSIKLLDKYKDILLSDIEMFCNNKSKSILPYLHYTGGLDV